MKIIGIICLITFLVSATLTILDDYNKSEDYYDE